MILKLVRENFSTQSTIGRLYGNGVFLAYILEDVDRGLTQQMSLEEIKKIKIPGKTAIPEGTYNIIITYSNRFKKDLPLLVDVPGFEGIRIHPGNFAENTEGCLLPGDSRSKDFVSNSKKTFEKVFNILKESINAKDRVTITIKK